jgi:hypothetical protein
LISLTFSSVPVTNKRSQTLSNPPRQTLSFLLSACRSLIINVKPQGEHARSPLNLAAVQRESFLLAMIATALDYSIYSLLNFAASSGEWRFRRYSLRVLSRRD